MRSKVDLGRRPEGRAGGQRRPAESGELIYGWHSAVEALKNPRRTVRQLLVTRNIRNRLEEAGVGAPLPEPVDRRAIERLTGPEAVHQGIALICEPLPEASLDACAAAGLFVVLDQVTDPHNVGAVMRSAAAFGAGGLVITTRHAPADTPVLAKAASGALEHVPLVRVANLARTLSELGEMGFLRVGLDDGADTPIETLAPAERIALVLGAEGKGLRRLTADTCDRLVRLPTRGPIASLNVSNAAAVALYAIATGRSRS
ncbi:MAG TPA: 23S rRNA (guanosine(2251)-2'-O)-methyltransferase RlmB [Afifellaceae bacterium]|nr:23S rRNA (guanosine(2251)-2'-O)-methyltransferase RlmB [Afifellaceae bacterium]